MPEAQVNPEPGKCWGMPKSFYGYCLRKARPGKLTCKQHNDCERAAQKLAKQLRINQELKDFMDSLRRPEPYIDPIQLPEYFREIAAEFGIVPPPETIPKGPKA